MLKKKMNNRSALRKRERTWKSKLSLILCILLCTGLFPAGVFADGLPDGVTVINDPDQGTVISVTTKTEKGDPPAEVYADVNYSNEEKIAGISVNAEGNKTAAVKVGDVSGLDVYTGNIYRGTVNAEASDGGTADVTTGEVEGRTVASAGDAYSGSDCDHAAGTARVTVDSVTVKPGADDQPNQYSIGDASAVVSSGENASVTVKDGVNVNISVYDPSEVRDEDISPQAGYSAILSEDGGQVTVGGDLKLDVNYEYDEHSGENNCISGVDIDPENGRTGSVKVSGDVNVTTGMDPFTTDLPADTRGSEESEFYYRSSLSHHSIGVNNEGGMAEVGGSVNVTDSHYGIGLDAGKKYGAEDMEDLPEGLNEYFIEQYSDYDEESDTWRPRPVLDDNGQQVTGENGQPLYYVIDVLPKDFIENIQDKIREAVEAVKDPDHLYFEYSGELPDGRITVDGDVNAAGGMYAKGMYVRSNGDVIVKGNVSSGNLQGIVPAEKIMTGVHNQGIVAQGYSNVLSNEARQEIFKTLDGLENYGEPIYKYFYGSETFLPWDIAFDGEISSYSGSDYGHDVFWNALAKAVLADGDPTRVTVEGDVKASGAMVTKGISNYDGDVTVNGALSAEGKAAAGILSVGDSAAATVGKGIAVEGENSAAGVASLGGKARLTGDMNVKADKDATGVWMRAGDVTVNGDVTVTGDKSTGIKTFNLENGALAIMAMMMQEPAYAVSYEAIWNCINRYADEMTAGEILAYFFQDDASQNVVVDGTVKADKGITALDNAAMARIAEDFVVRAYYGSEYQELTETDDQGNPYSPDPRSMSDDELRTALAKAEDQGYSKEANLYKACLKLRDMGAKETENPDITVWKIDAKDEVVNHGTEKFSWKEFLKNWTFILPDEGLEGMPSYLWNDDVMNIDLGAAPENGKQSFADKVQEKINYIIKINSVKDTDGNELDTDLLDISGGTEHKGFLTSLENGILRLKSGSGTYELQKIWNGLESEHDGWGVIGEDGDAGSGSFFYKVIKGGGIMLNAILKKIVTDPEPEQPKPGQPKPEQPAPEKPKPEQPVPEKPKPEQPAPEQPKPEQPALEKPKPEQPKPEQPAPEEPAQGQKTAPAAEPAEHVESADVIIIGADITGLMAADELQKENPELKILVIEDGGSLRDFGAEAASQELSEEDVTLFETLDQIAADNAANIRVAANTDRLLTEGGKVTGVAVTDASGRHAVRAKEVLLTDDNTESLIAACIKDLAGNSSEGAQNVKVTDAACQVLYAAGQPVEGLYAAADTADLSVLPAEIQDAPSEYSRQAKLGMYAADMMGEALKNR